MYVVYANPRQVVSGCGGLMLYKSGGCVELDHCQAVILGSLTSVDLLVGGSIYSDFRGVMARFPRDVLDR